VVTGFRKKDHAQTKSWSGMMIANKNHPAPGAGNVQAEPAFAPASSLTNKGPNRRGFLLQGYRYGSLIAWAKQLGRQDCATLLQQNLDEDKAADRKLTAMAESNVNREASKNRRHPVLPASMLRRREQ
jgi:hypothetical protein